MEGAETYKLPSPLFEHHMLRDHIHDVSPLPDGINGAGVELGGSQADGALIGLQA